VRAQQRHRLVVREGESVYPVVQRGGGVAVRVREVVLERAGRRGGAVHSPCRGFAPHLSTLFAPGVYKFFGAAHSDDISANRNVRDFGREVAHAAVTRRPPIPRYTMVPRTGGYAHDVGVWALSIVQGPFSVAPYPTVTIWQLFHLPVLNCVVSVCPPLRAPRRAATIPASAQKSACE
jgi:hypothetical protein